MNGRGVIFELLGGLFGWVWIGASIAAIIFAVLALVSECSWWNVGYSVFAGAVAKWLSRGFFANRDMIVREQEMIDAGMSKQDAIRQTFNQRK